MAGSSANRYSLQKNCFSLKKEKQNRDSGATLKEGGVGRNCQGRLAEIGRKNVGGGTTISNKEGVRDGEKFGKTARMRERQRRKWLGNSVTFLITYEKRKLASH